MKNTIFVYFERCLNWECCGCVRINQIFVVIFPSEGQHSNFSREMFQTTRAQDHHRIHQKKSAWDHKSCLLLIFSMNQTQQPSSCAPSNRHCTHPVKLMFFPESVLNRPFVRCLHHVKHTSFQQRLCAGNRGRSGNHTLWYSSQEIVKEKFKECGKMA
jgi:hypothetical protein